MGVWIAASTPPAGAAIAGGVVGVVTGALAIDLGVGRRTRALGPKPSQVGACGEEVFDVIGRRYLLASPRPPLRAALERGTAGAGFTARRCVADLVQPRSRRSGSPGRAGGLPAGPWPSTARCRAVHPDRFETGTHLTYEGELAADLWRLGQLWRPRGRAMGASRRHLAGGDQGRSRAPSSRWYSYSQTVRRRRGALPGARGPRRASMTGAGRPSAAATAAVSRGWS